METKKVLTELEQLITESILEDQSHFYGDFNTYSLAISLLENNVTIQRHGHWLGEGDGYADGELVYDVWYCSECNNCIDDGTDDPANLPRFCSECGAKMDGAVGTFTGFAATAATDINDGCKWKRSAEELPKNFVSVLGYIPSAAPMPKVRECYTIHDQFYFPALNAMYSAQAVTRWRYMPEEPKEEGI